MELAENLWTKISQSAVEAILILLTLYNNSFYVVMCVVFSWENATVFSYPFLWNVCVVSLAGVGMTPMLVALNVLHASHNLMYVTCVLQTSPHTAPS